MCLGIFGSVRTAVCKVIHYGYLYQNSFRPGVPLGAIMLTLNDSIGM